MLDGIIGGFINCFQPINLLMLFSAVVLGFFGGAMPGISGITMIVVLMPITYGMDPIPVFVLMTALYAATAYSGSISAIMFRIPGTPEAVATTFDGYAMGQKGMAGEAIGLSMTSSAFGGIVGAIFLMLLAQPLARFALQFSSPEFFAMAVMGLSMVATLSAKDITKGVLGVFFGLFIATIGIDNLSGASRFTFGSPYLMMGLDLVPFMIGLFGVSELLKNCTGKINIEELVGGTEKVRTKLFPIDLLKQCFGTMVYGTMIGNVIGILPGVGGTTASIVSYSESMRISKHPEKFGTGCPEGIVAPEAANNSAATMSFVPLISLGIPGSATTAVIMGAFVLHGLQPGPMLLSKEPVLVYTIFAGLFLVNIMMMFFCKPFTSLFIHTKKIPYSFFAPLIFIFCFVGTYSVRNSMFDIWVMIGLGVIGYFFDKVKFPMAPIILGVVLGPMAERELRRALLVSGGSFDFLYTRPICLGMLLIAAASFVYAIYKNRKPKATANA